VRRSDFLSNLIKLADPVLAAAACGELFATMSVEEKPGANRVKYTGLEAIGRLLNGLAPWLSADIYDNAEVLLRQKYLQMACSAIDWQTNPNSPDFADYTNCGNGASQFLVDAAFLAQAILRAPSALWSPLPDATKENVIRLFQAVRKMTPYNNNWVLFSTEVELLWKFITGKADRDKILNYFNLVESWYFGDGWYGDGPKFATDYYNSLVIHPMMLDICDYAPEWMADGAVERVLERAKRFAEVLENLVAPDGTYIAVGRSLAYRCGVFHLLAMLTQQNRLSQNVPRETARDVLYSVVEKTLTPSSYREDGFLNIGINAHQPEIGESYISTGSLYLASAAFLPLGISPCDPFWTVDAPPWTQKRIWGT